MINSNNSLKFTKSSHPFFSTHIIEAGYSEQFPAQLTAVKVTSATAQVIKYGYGLGVVKFDRVVTETTVQQSSVISDIAPETIGTSRVNVLSASIRKRVIFTADSANTGTVCLGGAGVTNANAAIILSAGDSWVEDTAANSSFYAIASAAGQILRISGA